MTERRKIEWDEKKVGLLTIAVMIASLAGVVTFGVGAGEGIAWLAVFSVALAVAAVLFGSWFGHEE